MYARTEPNKRFATDETDPRRAYMHFTAEYGVASLCRYMVSVYCFVTYACARRPQLAQAPHPACRGRRRASRSETLAASQAFECMHIR